MAKPKKLMGIQQNQLHCDVDTQAILTYLCEESNNLYNCGVYWARQIFFKTSHIVSKYALSMQSVETFMLKRCPL